MCTGTPHSRPGSAKRVGQLVNQRTSGHEHHHTTHQRRRSMRQGQFLMRTHMSATSGRVRTFRHQHSAQLSARRPGVPTAVTHNMGHLVERSPRHLCPWLRVSLPRHDPGHQIGGAAPSGPPQADCLRHCCSSTAEHYL